jgi:hypothetical protein
VDITVRVSPWKFVAVLLIVLAAIMETSVVLQKVTHDRTGTRDYLVHWGLADFDSGIEYPSLRFENWRQRFDVDLEQNIPTWYSAALLLLAAWLMLSVANRLRQRGKGMVWHWRALAVVFVALSADEAAMLHEMAGGLDSPGAALTRWLGLEEVIHFDWVLVGVVFVLVVAVLFLPAFIKMTPGPRFVVFIAVVIFLTGTLVVETIAGQQARDVGFGTMSYYLLTVLEESLEGIGLIMGILGLLMYMKHIAAAKGIEQEESMAEGGHIEGGQRAARPPEEESGSPLPLWLPPSSGRRSA